MTDNLSNTPPLRKEDVVELRIEKLAFEGKAITRHEGFVVFIEKAVPGDLVRVKIIKKKKQFAEAIVLELLEPSPLRVQPECRHAPHCGGCRWQHLQYAEQLAWKREHVRDAFERIGGFEGLTVHETLASEQIFYYRNKMEFSFGTERWLLPEELGTVERGGEPFALGLHAPGRYDRILHVDDCRLESPESKDILNLTREFFLEQQGTAYSTDTHTGNLRNLIIREGKHSGQRMVYLLTSGEDLTAVAEYNERLLASGIPLTTVVHGISSNKSGVATADTITVLHGPGYIEDAIGNCRFRISPTSFFQTNTLQAERLYTLAAERSDLKPADSVWDLYCGAGTIALFIASKVKNVLGVELHAPAIEDAKTNAALNASANVRFECADILEFVRNTDLTERPDVILVDPPRAGLHPNALKAIGPLGVERLTYVSCNPASAARDCMLLKEYGYEILDVHPVDMFPHTYHIECVIALRRK